MVLTALDLSPVLMEPIRTISPNRVYAANGSKVRTVMAAGGVLVRDHVALTAAEDDVRAEAQYQAEALARRAAPESVHEGMALLEARETGQL